MLTRLHINSKELKTVKAVLSSLLIACHDSRATYSGLKDSILTAVFNIIGTYVKNLQNNACRILIVILQFVDGSHSFGLNF